VPAKFASQCLRVFNDNIDEAIQSFFDNGGNPDGEIPDRYRPQSSAQQSVPPQYFYDDEGVLHGESEEEEDGSNEPQGVPLISAPPCSGVLYQKLYPIIRGPFSYGLVYSPAQDDFITALFVPMRRDDIGPHAYEDIARDAVLNIRAMLNAEIRYPRHWEGHPLFDPSIWYLRAQLSHYGLKREVSKQECREALRAAAKMGLLRVPREIMELEYDLRRRWEDSKVRQKHKLKRVRQWNDEIVMGKLQEAELVGWQQDDLRMWETVEGREQYRKDAVRGRELEGMLKEKMESGEYPKWQVKLWMEEYPKLSERVRHMENIVQAMNLGTFKESQEYEIYTGVYEAVERQSAKEHLESLKQRDGFYAWANDDENNKMNDGIGPEAFLQELRDEQEQEARGNDIKEPLTFSRGNLGAGNDGFYAKTIRAERHEAAQRETERDERDNWEMGIPHDYRTAEEKMEDEKIDGRLRDLVAPSSNQEEDPWGIASLRVSQGVQARSQYTDVASYSRNTAGATSNQYEGGWGVEIPHEYRAAQERTVAERVQYRPSRQQDLVLDGWVPRGAAASSDTARGSSGRGRPVPRTTNEDDKARKEPEDGNLFPWGLSDTMQEMLAAQQSSFKK
jgi:hypothetical protein